MNSLLILSIAGWAAILTATGQKDSPGLDGIRAYLKIDENLSTSGQIDPDEIPAIKDAGFQVVINLAPADEKRNRLEGYQVAGEGMTYVQIPVSWENPTLEDLQMFFDVMDANRDRKTFVHCIANMRVSVFVYLYRTLRRNIPDEEAAGDLRKIWDPEERLPWKTLIERARAKYSK